MPCSWYLRQCALSGAPGRKRKFNVLAVLLIWEWAEWVRPKVCHCWSSMYYTTVPTIIIGENVERLLNDFDVVSKPWTNSIGYLFMNMLNSCQQRWGVLWHSIIYMSSTFLTILTVGRVEWLCVSYGSGIIHNTTTYDAKLGDSQSAPKTEQWKKELLSVLICWGGKHTNNKLLFNSNVRRCISNGEYVCEYRDKWNGMQSQC